MFEYNISVFPINSTLSGCVWIAFRSSPIKVIIPVVLKKTLLAQLEGQKFTQASRQKQFSLIWWNLKMVRTLKLVPAIFIFITKSAPQKLWKMLFISSKKLFPFSRYSNVCIFPYLFIVSRYKRANKSGIIDVMNWLA